MNKEQLKALVKQHFNLTEIKLATAKLSDGTVIEYDGELAEGTEINIVAEDETRSVATDGEYVLEDETKVTVTDGKVSSVEVKEEDAAAEEEEVVAVEEVVAEEEMNVEDIIEVIIAILQEKLGPIVADVEEMKAKFSKFANQEETKPTKLNNKEKFNKEEELLSEDRKMVLAQLKKRLNK